MGSNRLQWDMYIYIYTYVYIYIYTQLYIWLMGFNHQINGLELEISTTVLFTRQKKKRLSEKTQESGTQNFLAPPCSESPGEGFARRRSSESSGLSFQ